MRSIPGKARTDKNVNVYLEMQCKSLWIKAYAKCINVNVDSIIIAQVCLRLATIKCVFFMYWSSPEMISDRSVLCKPIVAEAVRLAGLR